MNVGSVDLKGKARAHVGNVVHIHQTEDRCLSDLRNTDPRLDKARIEATKGGLLKDSYRWILEHSDFRQWRDDEQSRLLWIKGDPGKGKTMLLCGIVNELAPYMKLKDEKANTLLSYFFCQAADERINSATAVLRGLIYLIVEQQPSLISHIIKKHKYRGATIFKDVNAWFALSEIFSDILEDKSLEQAYVIIDALDECVNDLPKLLDFINTKSTISPRVKWIVSSRNWPDIEERLDSASQQRKLCLELNEKSISTAVDAYISHQVDRLAQKRKYNAETKHAVRHHLSSNSNDAFLWIALVCQNLEKISLQNTLLKLNEFPPGLDALYERMTKQIHRLEDIRDTLFCCRILATLLLVYRPVTLAELGCLIELPNDAVAVAVSIREAIGLCGSFLTIRDNQVYFIHQSAKDYLSNDELSTFFFPSTADVHADIFSRSIQAMSVTLQRNIYNLQSPGVSRNEIKTLDPDPLSAIRYSCVHWIDHFRHMRDSQSQDHDEKYQTAFQFLQKYFLYWLEALSLTHGDLSGRTFLAFSADGRYLASGSGDKTIKIWDTTTGKERQTIRSHNDTVWLVTYSADGCYLATGSLDKTIKIWNVATGKKQHTLMNNSGWTRSIAFSADSRYLASGLSDKTIRIWNIITASRDKTIKIWDTTTGKERQTLKFYTRIKTMCFDNAIKLDINHQTETQSTVIAQVLSPDSHLTHDQDQRRQIINNTKKSNHLGYGLSTDKCWITWNEHKILWLPPEYRPLKKAVWFDVPPAWSPEDSPTDVIMALCSRSGRVVILRMSGSEPYSLLL
ncbi:hypothetical protein V8C43DRAFT_314785 [Trichoderma afarasin]